MPAILSYLLFFCNPWFAEALTNKQEIIQKIQALGFPEEDYWLVTGGAMVLYGIRNETHDIDLGCSRKLADRLEAEGYLTKR